MKRPQLLGVAIAGVCGLGAFFGVMSLVNRPATVVKEEVQTNTTQVLVAKTEIGLGQMTAPENFRWQDWPQNATSPAYVQRSQRPNAIRDLSGSVARAPLLAGEPVTAQKLVKAGDGGVLAAILPPGMRAISTRIKEETSAGRLILPNDHVDVILTLRRRGRSGDQHVSDTLFRNVRVLAIGQLIEAREGKKLAEGNTATLELTPQQAEELAAANSRGEISLALRSIADIQGRDEPTPGKDARAESIKVLRYGVKTRAYGVN
ncbi:MAG: Flp pilus assembly protein CpaB [Hyphomicrobiaceae bacterium]|nr:MAG: Flp pilus assembly protein CpaB [Hyphomicrobiaceae bacterium]